jgi:EmrB/QacA subfamily drug resistance transporter
VTAPTEPGPASLAALRNAVLAAREPPPLAAVAGLASYRWFVVGTVCIGAFMGQVDASMTQMLLPRLERDFAAPLSTVSWVAVGYILTMASFMPIFGRLADMIGRKLLYTGAFLLFVVGSALCGFAPDLPTLVAFRIVQGIGAALLTANSIAIVVLAAGPGERGRALGLQSAAQAIGLGAGPAIGGVVLDTLDWHWAFWINVPFGLAGAVLGWFVLPQTRHLHGGSRFDWTGALLIAPALTAVVAVLNESHAWGVTSPAFIACVAAAIILLALFVRAERRAETPLIDFSLLRQRPFLVGNLANFLSYAMLFGVFFLIPFVLVRVYQDSEWLAGVRLSIVPVMLGLLAPIGGALYDRFGARMVTVSGMAICVAALGVLHVFLDGRTEDMPLVMLGLALFGVGQGLFVSPNSSAIMATAPEELTGEAGSLLNVVRYLGISTGIAGTSTLLAVSIAAEAGAAAVTVNASGQVLVDAGRDVILMLGALGLVGGALSLMRTVPRKARDPQAVEL